MKSYILDCLHAAVYKSIIPFFLKNTKYDSRETCAGK